MDLVAQYLIAARADGRSSKTLAWHRAYLKQFDTWRNEHGVPDDPELRTPSVLRAYVIYQQDRTNVRTGQPLSGSYINGLIRSFKAFCRWLYREELVGQDLFARVKVPKLPTIVVPALSGSEINRLLASIRAGR
jgi:site-specific recombinase XerD